MPRSGIRSFQATLEPDRSPLQWVIIRIPFDVAKVWNTRGRLKVKGTINGFAFRSSVFPAGAGTHRLLVNRQMQTAAGVRAGMAARFQLEPDSEERTIVVPPELQRVLKEDRALPRWFDRLNYSMRKYFVDRVTAAKTAETRARRADQVGEQLLAAMQAERELPPLLRSAFTRDPLAAEGWKGLSATQRRRHLLGIFYYRTSAAQTRRAAKALGDARAAAQRQYNPGTGKRAAAPRR
jgi:uncharacterized protein YdeI (YjbR/CyaY-like superfamily)